MVDVAMVIVPGSFHGGIAAFADCFALATERRDRIIGAPSRTSADVTRSVLSVDGAGVALDSSCTILPDRPIASTDRFDFIWLPAFRTGGEEGLRRRRAASGPLLNWLSARAGEGAIIGASGSAVMFPLAAGLARRRSVPVAPPLRPVLRALFPSMLLEERRHVVDHGKLLLSSGGVGDLEAMTRVFERLFSPESGHWLRSILAEERAVTGGDGDALVDSARLLLEQRFAGPVSIADLATELHVSHSGLIRHFNSALGMSPEAYLHKVRIDAAKRLLARPHRTIESVALAVGYADSRNFRQMFRARTGMSASVWRRNLR